MEAIERQLAVPGSDVPQRTLDAFQIGDWVNGLADWQVIAHFTWRDRVFFHRDGTPKPCGVSVDSAKRGYETFMAKKLCGVSYFYAVEQNPSRDGHHVHALWADCLRVRRQVVWADWLNRNGRNRIEPVRGRGSVVDYCAKYCTKSTLNRGWWNVKLQWHWRVRSEDFKLGIAEPGPEVVRPGPIPKDHCSGFGCSRCPVVGCDWKYLTLRKD